MTMISFIVIGRNEGWKLKKCLDSVVNCIAHNRLTKYEVIYVDSASTDDSVKAALSYHGIRVFSITGRCNAAVARNIGAKESTGDVLFFIDGDMEIEASFLSYVYNESDGLKNDYCSGHLIDYVYDRDGKLLTNRPRTYQEYLPHQAVKSFSNGGIFLIKSAIWHSVNGMKTEFRRNEDLDLAMRLYKRGVSIVRHPQVVTKHHTFDYTGASMSLRTILRGDSMYPTLMLRRHFLSIEIQKKSLRSNYTAYLLLLTLLSLATRSALMLLPAIMYFVAITIRSIARKSNVGSSVDLILFRIICRFLSDIQFVLALFLFWPRSEKLDYVECSTNGSS